MMQTQTQVPSALQVLMSMGAQPTAPGPMGQPIETVAMQKAIQQSQGLPQMAMAAGQAAPSVMRNMEMQKIQQMLQQALQAQQQSPGIAGLPAPNMQRMADGGVVGYASRGYVDPQFPEVYETYIPRDQREPTTGLEEEELFGKTPKQRAIEKAEEELLGPIGTVRRGEEGSAKKIGTVRIGEEGGIEKIDIQRPPSPPRAEVPARTAASTPTGIATALPATPTLEKSGVATAGDAIAKAAAEREARMRGILTEREKMAAGMADLNAEGIAALQEANRARQEMLAKQRADDKFNRQMALLRGFQGDRAAYDRSIAGQQARDEAANQAQLMHQQAVLKLREAQQAKQLGQFDRALAFEQQAADLENKARTSALEAQRIAASMATSEYTGRVNLREQDIRMQEGAANRANAMELERMRRATADRPGETERIFNRFNELKAKDPAAAEKYLQDIERIKGAGRGITERQDVNELKALIASLRDQADPMKNMDRASREQASALLRQAQEKLAQMSGLGGSSASTQLPAAALSQLKEGLVTTFANGQKWTLQNGQPTQVK